MRSGAAPDHQMNGSGRILIVEDEQHIAEGLRFNFEADGHEVVIAADGERALNLLLGEKPGFDAVVLDVMLPGKSGVQVASEVRAAGEYVPILMLTARSRPEDVLRGFAAGADDYLPKPFELSILIARVKGLLRRRRWNDLQTSPGAPQSDIFSFSGRTIDFSNMALSVGEKEYRLTQMECELLRYLVRNAGQVVPRRAILEQVWGLHEDTDTRAIDNFVMRLRKYLEDRPSSPTFLLTVRGVGYRFEPSGRSGESS
jgi:DNA-binding response OmpR family regulator